MTSPTAPASRTTKDPAEVCGGEPQRCPAPESPFAAKMAFYRTQHTSRGVRITHMIGVPAILMSLPLLFTRTRIGITLYLGGWALQIFGHRVFEHNMPSTHKGWITYQLTGVIDVCEMYGELLARRSQRRATTRPSA